MYSKPPPSKLQNRFRREVSTLKDSLDDSSSSDFTTESPINTEETQTEIFNPIESRFGFHHEHNGHRRHHGHWHSNFKSHKNFELEAENFGPQGPYPGFGNGPLPGHGFPQGNGPPPHGRGPFYGRGPPPPWGNFIPPNGGRPDFGIDCNDHRHDSCHNRPDTEKLKTTTVKLDNKKCCPCGQNSPTTTTALPKLDVRFQN